MSTTSLESYMGFTPTLRPAYPGHKSERIAEFLSALGATPDDMGKQFPMSDLDKAYRDTGGDTSVDTTFDDPDLDQNDEDYIQF